eukprot:TRINITY_DN59926_c0_g1_i2.p1 TRINITY_DN59926_c0_g1~~TRINITY_DN59926_c0_g1_i2.p1  ORF type:complete len:205 (+),score=9.99 TRINITY_DN59926_c0_g1_i2:45-659(+)
MPPKFSPNALHATKIIGLQDIPPWSVDTTPPLPKNRRTVDWKKEKLPSTVHTFDPILNTKISLVRYDITRISVDAVVNAANGGMMGGGGIDGAIHAAAGPQLKMELAKLMSKRETKRVPSGSTVLSQGHKLPAKHILHTVGPIYSKQKAKTSDILLHIMLGFGSREWAAFNCILQHWNWGIPLPSGGSCSSCIGHHQRVVGETP